MINGIQLRALLDTGANVSTISHGKFFETFNDVPLQPLQEFKLNIEGAGGQILPYLGFIEVDLTIPKLSVEPVSCVMLVTPDTT